MMHDAGRMEGFEVVPDRYPIHIQREDSKWMRRYVQSIRTQPRILSILVHRAFRTRSTVGQGDSFPRLIGHGKRARSDIV